MRRIGGWTSRGVEYNIKALAFFQFLKGCMIMMPVVVVFFQSVGLSMQDIMWTQAVFSATTVLFEIPSGYFSDVLGRRRTLIIGACCSTLGFALYTLANGFAMILVAEIVLGLGMSFVSGTDSALLYDSLKQLGEGSRSIQAEGRQISYGNFAESIAGVVGGFLAAYTLRVPLYAQVLVTALMIPLAWSLVEPERESFRSSGGSLRGIMEISHSALIRNERLRWILLFSGVIGAGTLTMVWFVQPYMQQCGLPLAYFGIAWTLCNLSVGFFSMNAHSLENRFSERMLITLMIAALIVGFVGCGLWAALWSLPILLCFYFVRGVNNPIFNTYINRLVPGDRRATVLSLRQLITRGVFCLTGPLAGYIADRYSQSTALLSCALMFAAAALALFLYHTADTHTLDESLPEASA